MRSEKTLEFINHVRRQHKGIVAVRPAGIGVNSTEGVAVFNVVPAEFNPAEHVFPQVVLSGRSRGIDAVLAPENAQPRGIKALFNNPRDILKSAMDAEFLGNLVGGVAGE